MFFTCKLKFEMNFSWPDLLRKGREYKKLLRCRTIKQLGQRLCGVSGGQVVFFLKEGRCSGKKEDFIAFAEIYGWLLWFVFLLMIFMMFLWAISFDLMLAGFQDKKRLNNVLFCFGGKYFPHIKQIQKFL